MELRNKTIVIVSREDWGEMFISKHHYAVELGKRGNQVFFINYPDQAREFKRGEIKISQTKYENVYVIKHRLFFPYFFKFRYNWLYQILVSIHIKRIIRKTGSKPDLVWSFDLTNSLPLKYFPAASLKIFMPVDEPVHDFSFKAAERADVLFSVTNEILEKYRNYKMPRYFINHGVGEYFIGNSKDFSTNKPLRVGYSGGLLRQEIDWETFFKIISDHPDIVFDFWGEYDYNFSFINTAANRDETVVANIDKLKSFPNVQLHGVLSPQQLLVELNKQDVLFICYDIKKDQSHGTNYHKILEYLGTGKVVVANNVSTYWKNYPGMIEMIESRDNNDELPALFSLVVNNLDRYNDKKRQEERINFTKQFTYSKQVDKIEKYLKNIRNGNA